MTNLSRISGTVFVLCGSLLALKFGFQLLSMLNERCSSALSNGPCQAIWLLLSALFVFLLFLGAMLLTNKLWGRNLFKAKSG